MNQPCVQLPLEEWAQYREEVEALKRDLADAQSRTSEVIASLRDAQQVNAEMANIVKKLQGELSHTASAVAHLYLARQGAAGTMH